MSSLLHKHYHYEWETISSDRNILDIVKGCQIEFKSNTPHQMKHPKEIKFSNVETGFIDTEIKRLLEKGVIVPSCHETGEFVLTIFVRPKPDGSHWLILNLKRFNEHVAYHHFKMESLKSAVQMMKPGCYVASVDLKDAYYSVHVDIKYQKFLKFYWRGNLYQYTCLPNGLACAPRLFTKLLKPVYSTLSSQGHLSVGYIDDSYLQGNTIQNCQNNIQKTVNLFTSLGFLVHPEKSVLVPTQKLTFLGFILDSEHMIISLTPERARAIKEAAKRQLAKPNSTIRELAEVIGKLVAAFQGCLYGPLHYRQLERDKISALKKSQGDYDAPVTLSTLAQQDLHWWIQNIENSKNPINHPNPTIILESDASNMGRGAVYQTKSTGGRWTHNEQELHINALEMKAAFFALQTFCLDLRDQHVRVMIDNTTAVTYINNMGGSHSAICNSIAREIWSWCIDRNLWLSAAHLPGTSNVAADKASRVFCDQTEWKLDETIFESITAYFYRPTVDLFRFQIELSTAQICCLATRPWSRSCWRFYPRLAFWHVFLHFLLSVY